jgi:hypothetical protein
MTLHKIIFYVIEHISPESALLNVLSESTTHYPMDDFAVKMEGFEEPQKRRCWKDEARGKAAAAAKNGCEQYLVSPS